MKASLIPGFTSPIVSHRVPWSASRLCIFASSRTGSTTPSSRSTYHSHHHIPTHSRCICPWRDHRRRAISPVPAVATHHSRTSVVRSYASAPNESAKLAALHARLSLPPRFTTKTLARCLIHPSADPKADRNNESLALLGQQLLAYYTAEWLMCHYPRLPMPILFAAEYAYVGPRTLATMAREWGVEAAAAPGPEVDAGLLQFARRQPGNAMGPDMKTRVKDHQHEASVTGTGRSNETWNYRRGMSSRIVFDDEFGDLRSGVHHVSATPSTTSQQDGQTSSPASRTGSSGQVSASQDVTLETAAAQFIRAVFGALYMYSGANTVHSFHTDHILSRHLSLHKLFDFKVPTRDLSRLCARENFEPPVARLISETGRHSRTPVFVVGVFSGQDKLGEDAGSSLNEARVRAAAAALRSWYLYSPPREDVRLPSRQREIESAGGKWKPQMVDVGEIVA